MRHRHRHQDVDAYGRYTHLVETAFVGEIRRSEAGKRSAELAQSAKFPRRIVLTRLDPDIQIFRVAWLRVQHHGVSAYNQVLNVVGVEKTQQFFEVGVHRRHRDAASERRLPSARPPRRWPKAPGAASTQYRTTGPSPEAGRSVP